jgi:hypothetical protein
MASAAMTPAHRGIVNVRAGCLAALVLLGFGPDGLAAIELIENGSFEEGVMESRVLSGWSDAPAGVNNQGLAVARYNFLFGGEPQISDQIFEYPPDMPPDFTGTPRPAGAGSFFGFAWGAGNASATQLGSATQFVDLASNTRRAYEFSAWLASETRDTDHAIATLDGESLESLLFDGNDQQSPYIVGSMNLDGLPDPSISATQDNWTLYRALGTIPALASSAAVVIQGADVDGVGNSAHVDLVSLQVVPEPSTFNLSGVLLSLAVWWAGARRGVRTQ